MSGLTISVALSTCNGSGFLLEQLQSIASQTLLPDEMVICDDVSDDDTLDIVNEYASQTGFAVRVVANEERLGPARNFEQAIAACAGDIILLADQDDVWRPHKVSFLVEALEQYPNAVYAFSDATMVDQEGSLLGQTLWESVNIRHRIAGFTGAGQVEILLKHNVIPGASLALRASFRKALLPFPAGWMHDYWTVLLGSVLGDGISVDDLLFDYRRHRNQVCGWRKKTFLQVCRDSILTNPEESWKKVRTFQELLDRVRMLSASHPAIPERLELLKEKEAHLLKRARARSSARPSRTAQVVSEVTTGRYRRFSNSWQSVIRDL